MKKTVKTPEHFLERRGYTVDGAIYQRAMLEILQTLRHVKKQVRVGEVSASVDDMLEYIENEKAYIGYVEGPSRT